MFWIRMERVANYKQQTDELAFAEASPVVGTRVVAQSASIPNTKSEILFLGKRPVSATLVDLEDTTIGPLLQTKWGQWAPWNTNMPHYWSSYYNHICNVPTGCTAVAIAQLLYFTHYKFGTPSGLYHTVSSTGFLYDDNNYSVSFSRGDYVDNSPRWDDMSLNYLDNLNSNFVADLMADVGDRLDMKYGIEESGAWPSKAAMQTYGLTYEESDYTANDVIDELMNGMPVMITAFTTHINFFFFPIGFDDGHTWVIDGLELYQRSIRYNYVWEALAYDPNGSDVIEEEDADEYDTPYEEILTLEEANLRGIYPGTTETITDTYETTSILMNWGWDGDSDSQRYSPNASIWTGNIYNYQYNKKIYKIRLY